MTDSKIIVSKKQFKEIKNGTRDTIILDKDSEISSKELPEVLYIANGAGHLAAVLQIAPVEIVVEEDKHFLLFTRDTEGTSLPDVDQRDITTIEYEKDLTDDDILAITLRIVKLDEEKKIIEMEKKAAAREWGAKLGDNETELSRFIEMMRTRVDIIPIDCYEDPDFQAGKMVYTDINTGEVVQERDLTNEERQMNLLDMEAPAEVDLMDKATEKEK